MKRIRVTLRKKGISNGRQSLYLDYYPPFFNPETGEHSRREFLKLYLIARPSNQLEKFLNEENFHRAELICSKRQNEVNKEFIYTPFELEELRKKETGQKSFLSYIKELAELRSGGNYSIWECSIQHFENFLKGKELCFADLTVELIEDFKSYLLTASSLRNNDTVLSQNTALSYFNKIKATLRKAYKQRLLEIDINAMVESIKEMDSLRSFLTQEEASKLFHTPCRKEIVKKAGLFSILTGLRYSDVSKLQWKDVIETKEGYFIRFRQKKTKKPELMPLAEQAVEIIGERKDPMEKVFAGLKKWDVDRIVPVWVAEAGITKHITFHCFRHTYATLQMAAGTDIFTVSKMLGHKDIRTTQIYTKLVDGKKQEASKKITL